MAAVATAPAGLSARWIVNRRVDLGLVIGSAFAGYIYLLLYTALHVKISLLWWFWSVGFDGTHIFATASRTYFNSEARVRDRNLLYGSLLFFFSLGPLMVLAGQKGLLALLVGVWAYYHVIRQHYGFLVLYKVKNRDLLPSDNAIDRVFLFVMLVFPPFHRFFLHHPEEIGIKLAFLQFEPFFWVVVAATAIAWLARQIVRFAGRFPIDLPKYLLFAAIIPLHWLTFAYMSWQAAVPTVTIVHNLQYHALVWFHNRNRYADKTVLSRSLGTYIAAALLFSAVYRIPGFQLGQVSDLAFGFFCGFGLTHYYLDSRIWRIRHDPGLREALQLVA
jgi:hypothetical protein